MPVVLGFPEPSDYQSNPCFMGAIVGRVANRVSGAGFTLDGRYHALSVNEPPNHLHGGANGLSTQNWRMSPDGARAVRLTHRSRHGDQGYPGQVDLAVTITLSGDRLRYDMRAESDRPTPVNLAQHSYYNLLGSGHVMDHSVQIAADSFTIADAAMLPTGAVASLDGKSFDFRVPRTVAQADPARNGLDMNLILSQNRAAPDAPDAPDARVTAANGLCLELRTDRPCLQLYSSGSLSTLQGHGRFAGLCLEPQDYPGSPNIPGFPSIIVTPDRPYRQITEIRISETSLP